MITLLIAALFALVALLLGYGLVAFRQSETARVPDGAMHVNMRLEVVWTGAAALLLLGVFLYVR